MASFTEFKLALGIKSSDRDTEYASILKGLIKELYTTYGIAITKDIETASETINSTYGTKIQLAYKNIVSLTISGYVEGVDYTLDKVSGELVILSTGSMLESTNYNVSYSYYVFINESNEIIYQIYPDTTYTTYNIEIRPSTLMKIEYDGNILVENVDYYFYNNTFEPILTITNTRIPFKLYLQVGYEDIPMDLKQCFYELAGIRFDLRDNKTYLREKSTDNAQGISTTYRMDSLPKHIKSVLDEYTGRRFIIW